MGWGDPLEESRVTHDSILAWKIPWTEDSVHGVDYGLTIATWHAPTPLTITPNNLLTELFLPIPTTLSTVDLGLLPAILGLPATKPRKGLLPGMTDIDYEEKLICCYTVEAGRAVSET